MNARKLTAQGNALTLEQHDRFPLQQVRLVEFFYKRFEP
jgi:hypothetical protein